MRRIRGGHAVVLGASMAGLFAARVLSDSYTRVTVVERDVLPMDSAQRRGVPQGRHVHALLARGAKVLDELFPGLTEEAVATGANVADLLGGVRWFLSGYRLSQADIGQPLLVCSRPMLEGHVRARVRALPGVSFLDGYDVVGIVAREDRRRISGVRVHSAGSGERLLDADLVLDATGRASRTPVWLEELGYQRPWLERLDISVGYSSRTYRMPGDVMGTDRFYLHGWTSEYPRAGAIAAIEDDRHLVTLAGILGDHPPTDPEGFDAFADSLQFPDVRDAMRKGEPLDDPVAFQYPADLWQHYERLRDFPEGLLVLGDAVCAFNPVYGQGMTSAALQAEALYGLLAEDRPLTWQRHFRAMAAAVEAPWTIATTADLQFEGVKGERTFSTRLINAYLPRLHRAAQRDPSLAAAFIRVTGLLDGPQGLLRPDRVLRVFAQRAN